MNLHTFFAETVAAGWAPRHPCTDPAELATLEVSGTRGNCISPLLQDGDTVYVDRNAKPELGDVVSFELSQRFVDAQNSDLPPGQNPWSKGAKWCKLFTEVDGLGFLLERHGNAMTATFAACEDPDDTPVLYPVRQIRRNGLILFGPDMHSAQVGLNAATTVYSSSVAGPVNVNTPGGTASSAAVLIASISPAASLYDTTQVVTVTGFMDFNAVSQQNDGYVAISTTASLNVGAVASAGGFAARNLDSTHPQSGGMFAIEQTYSVSAGASNVYYIYGAGILSTAGASAGSYINVSNVRAKVEVITR